MLMDFHLKSGKTVTVDLDLHEIGELPGGLIAFTNYEDPHIIGIRVEELEWVAVHPDRKGRYDPFFDIPRRRRLDPR